MNLRELFIEQGEALGADMSKHRQRFELDQDIEKALSYGDYDLIDVLVENADVETNVDYKEHGGYAQYKAECIYESLANDHVDDSRI